jgi:ribosomal-protein-alanine N-acetyltransferase
LQSKRLEYRKFDYDDFDDLQEIMSNPNVCEYIPGGTVESKEVVSKWLNHFIRTFNDEHGTRLFAILEQGKSKVIGYGGIGYVKEFDQMEIMYVLNESVWGKGYASEASLYFKQLAKEQGIEELIGLAHVDNIASQKVLLKTGYQEIKQVHIWGLDCFYYEMDL